MKNSNAAAVERLRGFLIRLGENLDLLVCYLEDPRAVLKEHGIEEWLIETIVKGDLDEIRKVFKEAGYDDQIIRGTGIIVRPVK